MKRKMLAEISKSRVLVAGDFFLDHYYYGSINRISPEAPVPVLNVTEEKDIPGGAANVVSNLCRLGCEALAFGVIGADDSGATLTEKLEQGGADTSGLVREPAYKTIVKARAVAGKNHQIVRLDFSEDVKFPLDAVGPSQMDAALEGCKVAILSDYGKGFCKGDRAKAFIEACNRRQIPVIVDPKGTAWEKYQGANWITPNFSEFAAVLGRRIKNTDEDVADSIAFIAEQYNIENVLVTRSELGMTLYHKGRVSHIRANAQEVFDVSGAGDTVVAVLAALLGAGADALEAVQTANTAAGIVVGKTGTAAVSLAELERELRLDHLDRIAGKIMDWDTLFSQVALWKANGETVAVANGCFDIFHKGHASLIQAASQCADKLVMAINADETVRKLKGDGRPVNAELDRAYVLAALESVAAVVIFPQDTPEELLSHIMPDVLVKGGEYSLEQVPGRQYAKRVELVNYIDGYSTTAIISKSKEG